MLMTDFEQALEIVAADYERLHYLYRVLIHVARLFSPVL
jgi:cardiolipin synthase